MNRSLVLVEILERERGVGCSVLEESFALFSRYVIVVSEIQG